MPTREACPTVWTVRERRTPMSTIKQILDTKGYAIWSIHPQESVFAAIQQMAEKEVGALVVLEGDAVVGIISERDYARKVVLKGRSSRQTEVRDIMTPDVIYVRLDQSIEECMSIVTERRIRHLPVLDNGRLVGIISIGDLVKTVIAEQQFIIEQLEHYISS
jgi:signal-transduction protein with cAMP-binding, CBS, and nucleotidyltransferase domain